MKITLVKLDLMEPLGSSYKCLIIEHHNKHGNIDLIWKTKYDFIP